MLEAVRNAFRLPDLRQKLLITFGTLPFIVLPPISHCQG